MNFLLNRKGANKSLDKYNAISTSQAIIEFTLDGTIVDANDNFLNVMGYTLKEIQGQHHSMFVEEQDKQSAEYKAFWERLARGEYDSKIYKRIGKNGKEIWIRASYNPIVDKKGHPYGVVKVATDITRDRLTNADYKGQIAAISRSQAVIEFNLDGTIIDANDNFLNVMGYSLQEVQGKHHSLFVDKAYRESAEYKAFWDNLGRGEFEAGIYKRFGKGGKEVWIQSSYNPIFDMNGKPFKVVKYASDITRQKLEYANFHGQVSAIKRSQAVIEFNLDGTIIDANENFLNTMGYSLDEVRGKHHSMFVDAQERNTAEYKAFWQKLGDGQAESRIYRRIAKSGKDVWIHAYYTPIFDMNKRPLKVIKFATNVTPLMRTMGLTDETVPKMEEITTAIQNMSAAINEINQNMTSSKNAVSDITQKIRTTSEASGSLMDTVASMEGVVQLIRDIAEQVNLLALNATIEAARAGESGKGFAVVANEVKNLANQTAKATDDIAQQISVVQGLSTNVADSIENIVSQAASVDDYVTSSADALYKQDEATREISHNTQSALSSVKDISARIRRMTQI